jgi:hypothetical protein
MLDLGVASLPFPTVGNSARYYVYRIPLNRSSAMRKST